MDGVIIMRVYFGKELRQPIYDAFLIIRNYLDNTFDIKESLWGSYKSKVGVNIHRKHTLYAITDQKYDSFGEKLSIWNALSGGYLGSTELKCGMLGIDVMFEKAGDE